MYTVLHMYTASTALRGRGIPEYDVEGTEPPPYVALFAFRENNDIEVVKSARPFDAKLRHFTSTLLIISSVPRELTDLCSMLELSNSAAYSRFGQGLFSQKLFNSRRPLALATSHPRLRILIEQLPEFITFNLVSSIQAFVSRSNPHFPFPAPNSLGCDDRNNQTPS